MLIPLKSIGLGLVLIFCIREFFWIGYVCDSLMVSYERKQYELKTLGKYRKLFIFNYNISNRKFSKNQNLDCNKWRLIPNLDYNRLIPEKLNQLFEDMKVERF